MTDWFKLLIIAWFVLSALFAAYDAGKGDYTKTEKRSTNLGTMCVCIIVAVLIWVFV